MRDTDPPYFQPQYSHRNVDAKGKIIRDELPQKTMVGPEIGEDWTRQFISTQAAFLQRHGQNGPLNAAWFLALAAASANNDTSPALLEQACAQGLPDEEVFRIGASLDSDQCARFLVGRNIDWSSFYVQPEIGAEIGHNSNATMASNDLIAHLIYPKEGARKKVVNLNNALEVLLRVHEHALPVKFIESVLESGQVNAGTRMKTYALGLEDGKATWVSLAIANGKPKIAAMLLSKSKEVSQDTLDEALLAIAMTFMRDRLMSDEKKALEKLAKNLVSMGANPDRDFELGVSAYHSLHGWNRDAKNPLLGSTRQWALAACLQNTQAAAFQKVMFPSPWPKIPGKGSWLDFGLSSIAIRSENESSTREVMNKILALSSRDNAVEVEATCRDTWVEHARRGRFNVLDALLDSAVMKKAAGKLAPETLVQAIQKVGGLEKIEEMKWPDLDKKFGEWWNNSRLDKVISWLPEDQALALSTQIDGLRQFALMGKQNIEFSGMSSQDLSAVKLALQACFQTPSPTHIPPLQQRRTL